RDSTFAVDELDVRAPLFDVSGRAGVETADGYAAELALDATVRPPGRPAASAAIRGAGTLDDLTVHVSVEPPYALEAELVAADILGDVSLDGTLRARIVTAEIGLDVPVAETNVELAFAGPI